MKLHEFCQMAGCDIELDVSPNGYRIGLTGYDGYVWPELEAYAECMEGGTTWSRGSGATPNDAITDLCYAIKGKLLAFRSEAGAKRRLVRAPEVLEL